MLNFRMIRLSVLIVAFSSRVTAFGDEPAKLAQTARFDLSADARAGSIEDGRVVEGDGSIARMNWMPSAEQSRGYTVNVPVSYRAWRKVSVQFTPTRTGIVGFSLMGPWEEVSKGVLYRQDVLWDDIRVEGATLGGGGFESAPGATGWSGGGAVVRQTNAVPAVEGTHYARTWHNQFLYASMKVEARRPVTIRLSARAVVPENFREMKRIVGRDSPAHRAARRFLRGANLGNGLEAPPGQDWGVHYTADDLRLIRAEGFDHARIPIGWNHYTGPGPEFRLRPEIFSRADELVQAGLRQGLGVIINIHHFDDFTTDPKGQTPKFLAIWSQLAMHYARAPEGLAFELLNEPRDAATTDVVNPIFAEAIRRIRAVDKNHTIFVGPGKWNGIGELPQLRLPDDDENLIVTVHSYEPFYFTHQGATWAGPDTKVTGILFPGPPATPLSPDPKLNPSRSVLDWLQRYNTEPRATNPSSPRAFLGAIEQAREWSEYYGRPIHVGEFGCLATIDPASRANYYRTFREAAERAGIGWAIWDWKAGFRYWDEKAERPEPRMHQALFGLNR
ncbi:MAG: glycoside hydrolase family 5 protein [Isosphaeraceae bacterium]